MGLGFCGVSSHCALPIVASICVWFFGAACASVGATVVCLC